MSDDVVSVVNLQYQHLQVGFTEIKALRTGHLGRV